ncbi:MAG: ATP-binding protein, partial [Staphylococcus equorum]|nr:ATP-binding protein [Staphylococcus equorum]
MKRMLSLRITETLKQYEANDVEKGLYCEKCGNRYDLHTFSSGYEYRDGCECSMIAAGKEAERKRKQKAVNRIFSQSNVNHSLKDVTVNNYQPQNQTQEDAKQTAIEYVKTFSIDESKSLILQGSYGTGKSHLAYAIAKAIKAQGYSVAFMHIPMLMDRIKATYNKNSVETTDGLVKLLSNIDLLVLDDI